MPTPGMRWRHLIISTLSSWLPGDPRGFRTRNHKIHSSGDYKHRPPKGEHAGLHDYSQEISPDRVVIPKACRAIAGQAILEKIEKKKLRVLVLSVGGMHAHALVELPNNYLQMRLIAGECKSVSSHAIRHALPGRVWAAGGTFKPVDDRGHQREAFQYILDHEKEGAWVWSFKNKKK